MSPNRVRTRDLDEACVQAVDLARTAAIELAGPDRVGPPAGIEAEGDRIVTHLFSCLDPAYAGWRWAVTVARASRAKTVTVSECVLLPGPDSLLAPDWVPWNERVRPGDLGVGDLLPVSSDDERLTPVAMLEGDDGVMDWDPGGTWAQHESLPGDGKLSELSVLATAGAYEGPGLRRDRALSAIGRDDAAERWYSSEHGPGTPLASAAPGPCATCGFLVPLSGPLGRVFGVCANEFAPDDGRVVALDHGCGAHSGAVSPAARQGGPVPVIDELGYDLVDMPGVSMTDTVFESLDRGEASPAARRRAARSRERFSDGTYTSPNSPRAVPKTHVHSHQRSAGGRLDRTRTSTISAAAQPAVMVAVMSWSRPSSGGGTGRLGRVTIARLAQRAHLPGGSGRDVLRCAPGRVAAFAR